MHKATRTQIDEMGDYYSALASLDCSVEGNKDMARQEFKDEADINTILRNFGVNNQQRTMVQFGDADYTIDLQQAMHAINDTQNAYQKMHPEIHKIYPTYEKFIRGMQTGAVAKDLERIESEKIPANRKAELRTEIDREKERAQILRDDEAAKIAEDHRQGRTTPKPEEKPK